MQYAVIELAESARRLIDIHEYQALQAHLDKIKDVEEDEASMTIKIVYGAYKVQPGHNGNATAALEEMGRSKGFRLGHVKGDACRAIELCDFVAYDPLVQGHALSIPFAALVRTHVEMPTSGKQAVTAFLRYLDQMTPADNVLNRPGLFAMKTQERRIHGAPITRENWMQFADEERAIRAAHSAF